MNLKKEFKISLISILRAGVILVFFLALVGIFVSQKRLTIPKAQAKPDPICVVNDSLGITGDRIRFTGVDATGHSWITRSASDDSKTLIGWDSKGAMQLDVNPCQIVESGEETCDHAGCDALLDCPAGTFLVSCDAVRTGNNAEFDTINCYAEDENTCHCQVDFQGAGSGTYRVRSVCCF